MARVGFEGLRDVGQDLYENSESETFPNFENEQEPQ